MGKQSCVRNKMSIKRATEEYGVPRINLPDMVKGRVQIYATLSQQTGLAKNKYAYGQVFNLHAKIIDYEDRSNEIRLGK